MSAAHPPAPWAWGVFATLVLAMLAIDLAATGRRRGALTLRSATLWSAAWIAVGALFALVVLAAYDASAVVTYFTAYLLEKSLSVDNLFVFALIFGQLAIPAEHQRRVLAWGILGALAMRGLLIAAGISLLDRFHWVIYPFAVLLLLAAARLLWGEEKERDVVVAACSVCDSWVARLVPVTPVLRDGRFWVARAGGFAATPLFIALVVVETSDVVFALDSIPAVLGVTREPFLVYTSNVFAMLGLRSLYFVLAGALARVRTLRLALAAILAFVAARMLLAPVVEIPNWVSLVVIVVAVSTAVATSRRGRYQSTMENRRPRAHAR